MGKTAKFAFVVMKNRVPEFQMLTSIMGCRCQMIKRINETQLKINAFPEGPIYQFRIQKDKIHFYFVVLLKGGIYFILASHPLPKWE